MDFGLGLGVRGRVFEVQVGVEGRVGRRFAWASGPWPIELRLQAGAGSVASQEFLACPVDYQGGPPSRRRSAMHPSALVARRKCGTGHEAKIKTIIAKGNDKARSVFHRNGRIRYVEIILSRRTRGLYLRKRQRESSILTFDFQRRLLALFGSSCRTVGLL